MSVSTPSDCLTMFILFLLMSGDVHPNLGPDTSNSSESDSNRILNILNSNIRCLRNKLNDLEALVDDIDILCLTETHLDPSVPDSELVLDDFNILFRNDRNMFGVEWQ